MSRLVSAVLALVLNLVLVQNLLVLEGQCLPESILNDEGSLSSDCIS